MKASPQLRDVSQVELDQMMEKHALFMAARPGGARAVLTHANLNSLRLSGANLAQADFYGACLARANLSGATLDSAVFFGADLRHANLTKASLVHADMRGALLRGAVLNGADLTEADLRDGRRAERDGEGDLQDISFENDPTDITQARLVAANLGGAKMGGMIAMQTDFSGASLRGAKLLRANLRGAKFLQADLTGADLSHADLRGANLTGALLLKVDLTGAQTEGAQMHEALTDAPHGTPVSALPRPFDFMLRDHRRWAETQGAEGQPMDLSGLDMRGVQNLAYARLSALRADKAVFSGLDMPGAELQAAHLAGADFRGVRLDHADLRGLKAPLGDFSGASLVKANLSPLVMTGGQKVVAELSLARFCHANLAGAVLTHAVLRDADLTGAILDGADLRDADLRGAVLDGATLEGALIEGAQFGSLK